MTAAAALLLLLGPDDDDAAAQVERPVTPRQPHVSPAGTTGARQQTVAGRTSGPAPRIGKHGHAAGGSVSATYRSWISMKTRCTNPRQPGWPNYGGRGIQICERWLHSFTRFLADMGERPAGTTLDRIDNDGHYEPGNVRWATSSEQRRNQRPASGYRHRVRKTHCLRGHEFTPENTITKSGGRRNCRMCRSETRAPGGAS